MIRTVDGKLLTLNFTNNHVILAEDGRGVNVEKKIRTVHGVGSDNYLRKTE